MQAVLFIPDFQSLTSETRAALPKEISLADAAFNISRAAMLVNCFATGRLESLRWACEDRLHQPSRGQIFPMELSEMIQTALNTGAHGCWISGAGPTIMALTGGHGGNVDGDSISTVEALEEVGNKLNFIVHAVLNKKRNVAAERAAKAVGAKWSYMFLRPDGADLATLLAWVAEGKL